MRFFLLKKYVSQHVAGLLQNATFVKQFLKWRFRFQNDADIQHLPSFL